ncbi:MAG: PAS domain-containing sensor histidine kinase [Patescibacteria group bacterium]
MNKKIRTQKIPVTDKRYTELLNISPFPIAIHVKGLIVYANQAALQLIQAKSQKEVLGKHVLKFIHPDYHELVKQRMGALMAGKKTESNIVQEKFVTLKRNIRDVELASISLEYNGERAVQSTIRDITTQKEFERKLLQSNSTLETIINSSPLAIYVVDVNGRVLLWNPVCEKIFGWTQEEVLGKLLPLPQKKKAAEFKDLMLGLLQGKPFSKDLVRYKKDGSEIHVNVSASPLFDENKKVVSIVAITSDVSERKKTEEMLKDSERKYRMMIEQSLLSTQILSPDGYTLQVNKAWERLWGLNLDMLKGYNMLNDKQLVETGVMPYIQKGFSGEATMIPAIKYETEKTIKNVTSSVTKWVQAYIYPVKDDEGRIREVVLVHEDITASKEFERQKDDFLGIASHELKTPVTSIKMYGQVLSKMFLNKGDVKAAELMDKMDLQVNKLSLLITDLLDVTKIQSGRMQFNSGFFDFNELLIETVDELQHMSENHKIVLQLAKSENVKGDRDRIGQVITNFITNAIKYSPNAQKIVIKTSCKSGYLTCMVQDFGIGISKQDLPRIFDQFYRSSLSSKTTFPGLGLGLFISKEIITRHKGEIWVESSSKKGTTFCFKIPIST